MKNLFPFLLHHWFVSIVFVLSFIGIFVSEAMKKGVGGATVSPQEAIQLMNKSEAIIVDIRNQDAFVRGHIINAIHLPFNKLQSDIQKLLDHKHKPIILVCAQGVEATKALKMINKNEFDQVSVLKGGLKAWREDKLPLEKGK